MLGRQGQRYPNGSLSLGLMIRCRGDRRLIMPGTLFDWNNGKVFIGCPARAPPPPSSCPRNIGRANLDPPAHEMLPGR